MDHARLNKTRRGFDRLAKIYDRLAKVVFGKSLVKGQVHFMHEITDCQNVLILGGGTGYLLEQALKANSTGEFWYVELSEKMVTLSQERIQKNLPEAMSRINWISGSIEDLPSEVRADAVCTMFFLDLFEGERLRTEVERIDSHLSSNARWLLCDFQIADRIPMRWFSRVLIWVMYRFFRWICAIPAGRLGQFSPEIERIGFQVKDSVTYFGGMVLSRVFERK